MSFSVVILSKNAANLQVCERAVRQCEPACRVVIVDDGLNPTSVHLPEAGCRFVSGEKPFIFARNANIGIRAAGQDDVILLNDDALLRTPNGFTMMSLVAQTQPEYGVIAASCNNVGNINQHQQKGDGLRPEARMVCFVCAYIPRRTIEAVGLLDEVFTDYGCDDDDYCLRVRQAGLKIGIYDGCFVDHASLKSQFRGNGCGDYRPNLKKFIAKHGVDNWGRSKANSDFADLFA